MALTLECVCAGSPSLVCALTKLTLRVERWVAPFFASLSFVGPPGTITFTGTGSVDITAASSPALSAWIAVWDSLYWEYTILRTFNSTTVENSFANFRMLGEYTCVDGSPPVVTTTKQQWFANTERSIANCVDGPTLRSFSSMGPLAAHGAEIISDPLGVCNGATSQSGLFQPDPGNPIIDLSNSETVCLCAAGGLGPYLYRIVSGKLPSGRFLNGASGCIEGAWDGREPGTTDITFEVVDIDGSTAQATCGLLGECEETRKVGNVFH